MDFFKNKMSPIKLSKFRKKRSSPKSMSHKELPPSSIINRFPTKISTITSLLRQPTKLRKKSPASIETSNTHYRYDEEDYCSENQQGIEVNARNSPKKKNNFADRMTKQYKDLSEFKVKDFLNKKPVFCHRGVKVDNPKGINQPENSGNTFRHAPNQDPSDDKINSIYQFKGFGEFRRALGRKTVVNTTQIKIEEIEKSWAYDKADIESIESFEGFDFDVLPAESLYNLKSDEKSAAATKIAHQSEDATERCPTREIRQNSQANSAGKHTNQVEAFIEEFPAKSKQADESIKKSHNLQGLTRVCKKRMDSGLQKLKNRYGSVFDIDCDQASCGDTKQPNEGNINMEHFPRTKNAPISSQNPLKSQPGSLSYRNPLVASPDHMPKCLRQKNLDDNDLYSFPNNQSIQHQRESIDEGLSESNDLYSFPKDQSIQHQRESIDEGLPESSDSFLSCVNQNNFVVSYAHSRKYSLDSFESDSWIPENYRMSNSSSTINNMAEKNEAWISSRDAKSQILKRTKSVDIFCEEGFGAFDNFEDSLRNVPVIHIINPTPTPKGIPVNRKEKPVVRQSSIVEEMKPRLNVNINKLICQFEKNYDVETISTQKATIRECNQLKNTLSSTKKSDIENYCSKDTFENQRNALPGKMFIKASNAGLTVLDVNENNVDQSNNVKKPVVPRLTNMKNSRTSKNNLINSDGKKLCVKQKTAVERRKNNNSKNCALSTLKQQKFIEITKDDEFLNNGQVSSPSRFTAKVCDKNICGVPNEKPHDYNIGRSPIISQKRTIRQIYRIEI